MYSKRLIAAVLTMAMMLSSLSICASAASPEVSDPSAQTSSVSSQEKTEKPDSESQVKTPEAVPFAPAKDQPSAGAPLAPNALEGKSPIKSISIDHEIELIENYSGNMVHMEEGYYYFQYNWDSAIFPLTLHMQDNSTVMLDTYNTTITYQGQSYYVFAHDNQIESPWKMNQDCPIYFNCENEDYIVNVRLQESPVKEIQLNPVKIIENTNQMNVFGSDENGQDIQYQKYDWRSCVSGTIIMKNGDTLEIQNNLPTISYQGKDFYFTDMDNQSPTVLWEPGKKCDATIYFYGYVVQVPIEIVKSPVSKIELSPIEIPEYSDGHYWEDSNGQVYFYYDYDAYLWGNEIIIYLNDGSQIKTGHQNNFTFSYDGREYRLDIADSQEDSIWKAGDQQTITIEALGYKFNGKVTVTASPFKSMKVADIFMVENSDGNYNGDRYHYAWQDRANGNIQLKNGESIHMGRHNVNYGGHFFPIYVQDTQSDAQWTCGNTYIGQLLCGGLKVSVPVSIIELPVDRIEAEPLCIRASDSGHYSWENKVKFTVYLKDGSSHALKGSQSINLGDKLGLRNVNFRDEQSATPWQAGNTYYGTLELLGVQAKVPITIAEGMESDGFEYLKLPSGALITSSSLKDPVMKVPSKLGGLPVVGILGLGDAQSHVTELILPDSLTQLDFSVFTMESKLEKLTIGKGLVDLDISALQQLKSLKEVNISQSNPSYVSQNGVIYDKQQTKVLYVLPNVEGEFKIPNTVTSLSSELFKNLNLAGHKVSISFGNQIKEYKLVDGVVYTNDMKQVIYCNPDVTGEYKMPASVNTIGDAAFTNCAVENVSISNSVTAIADYAFSGCKQLKNVMIPNSVKSIGEWSFADCGSLKQVNLPEGLESIGSNCFENTSLRSISLPDSLKYLGSYAFSHCGMLKECNLGSGITLISYGAFEYTCLESVVLPKQITQVSFDAFKGSKLRNLKIEGENVTLANSAFADCPLGNVDLSNVVYIGENTFKGSDMTEVHIPNSIAEVSYLSFSNSKKLAKITLPDSLNLLDGHAFDHTEYVNNISGPVYMGSKNQYFYGFGSVQPANTKVAIKEGTTLVAQHAFDNQFGITSLTIPSTVCGLEDADLRDCLDLETITVNNNPNYSVKNGCLLDKNGKVLFAPVKSIKLHKPNGLFEVRFGSHPEFWGLIEIQVTYKDNYVINFPVNSYLVSNYDPHKIGEQNIKVGIGKHTLSMNLKVKAPEISKLKLESLPETNYDLHQPLRTNGLQVMAVTSYDYIFPVTDYEISGYNPDQVGTQTVTVSYGGKTAEFYVTVSDAKESFVAPVPDSQKPNDQKQIEISAPKNAIENGAKLQAKEKKVSDIPAKPPVLENNKAVVFDLSFQKDNKPVQLKKTVTVALPVPDGMNGAQCQVFHISDDGKKSTSMNAKLVDGFLEFDTTHFGYFGIVELPGVKLTGSIHKGSSGDVLLQLFKGNTLVGEQSIQGAQFSFSDLGAGEYCLKAIQNGCPQVSYNIQIKDKNVVQKVSTQVLFNLNRDEKLDSDDAVYLIKYLLWSAQYPIYEDADVNGDSKINEADAIALLKSVLF